MAVNDLPSTGLLHNTQLGELKTDAVAFVKLMMLAGGAVLSTTLGAFLATTPPNLSVIDLSILRVGWVLLSAGVILGFAFMLLLLISQVITLDKMKADIDPDLKVQEQNQTVTTSEVTPPFQINSTVVNRFYKGPQWLRYVLIFVIVAVFFITSAGLIAVSVGAANILQMQPALHNPSGR